MQELAFFPFDPGSCGSPSKDSLPPPPGVVSPCGTNPPPGGGLTLRHQPSPRLPHTGRQHISHLEKDLLGLTTCFAVARAPQANWRCLGNALEGQLGLVGPNPSCANHSGWCPGKSTCFYFVR